MVTVALGLALIATNLSARAHGDSPERLDTAAYLSQPGPALPLRMADNLDLRKVALGRRLFQDPRLSVDKSVSCASCHALDGAGVDNLQQSVGVTGNPTAVNAPTVFNSGLSFVQFWDGRADSLEEQIEGPLHHPDEMGSNWETVIERLEADRSYRNAFLELYDSQIDSDSVKDAIATFERSLVTVDAPFDRFLLGEDSALSEDEKSGYRLFTSLGCSACHQGRLLGGNLYQKLGIFDDYFQARAHLSPADLGRYNITGRDADRFVFKVPSLRNVVLTAPYFHDGSVEDLETAITIMGYYQLGRTLTKSEVQLIASFLGSLTAPAPATALSRAP